MTSLSHLAGRTVGDNRSLSFIIETINEMLVLTAFSQNTHGVVSSEVNALSFRLSHHLHQYFVYVRCKGSGETVRIHGLV